MKTHVKSSTCKNIKTTVDDFLIVEGTTDVAFLSSFLDNEIVQIGGFSLTRGISDYLIELAKIKTPIILTDPDEAGETIKNNLLKLLPNAKAVTVAHIKNPKRKNGIAECRKEEILTALSLYIIEIDKTSETISSYDLLKLGLAGFDSQTKRNEISKVLKTGNCNAKTFLKRINSLGLTLDELERICKEYGNQ